MGKCLAAILLVLSCWSSLGQAMPLRILPLGDSITHGITGRGADGGYSYRYWLWQKFVDVGRDVDFVGSLNTPFDSALAYPLYQGEAFDPDHEGHYGWSTRMINENLPTWLMSYDADVVLLHLGHNDYWREILPGNATYADTQINLTNIIGTLRADNPNIIVLLAQVVASNPDQPPEGSSFPLAHINTLNALVPIVAAATTTSQSPVYVVDQFTGFDPLSMIYDGVHTNALGEQRMADVWWQALEDNVFLPGDFDTDGDVDGRDFLAWQRGGSLTPFSAGDLADWQAEYNGGLISALRLPPSALHVAVPEPGGLANSCLASICVIIGRRRR